MPKFKIKTNKGTFVVNANRQPTSDEIQQIASQQQPVQPTPPTPSLQPEPQGLVQQAATGIKRAAGAAPVAGQFVGGITGAALVPQRPFLAGGIGGVAGRGIGTQIKEEAEVAPFRTAAGLLGGPFIKSILPPTQLSQDRISKPIEEAKKAILPEIGAAVIGGGIGRGFKALGQGAMRSLVGTRTAQRAQERGWRALLKPEFFKGRLPKFVAEGMDKFFARVSKVTGERISTIIRSPELAKITIPAGSLNDDLTKIIGRHGAIDDFSILVSPGQKKILKTQLERVGKIVTKNSGLEEIWTTRKDLDKIIFGKRWADEARDFLLDLRTTLNRPLIDSNPELGKAFGRYAFVKKGESEFGKSFKAILDETGETFSTKLEKFLSTTLSTSRDESIRLLKRLDSFLGVKDRIVEDALDAAAAEVLDKGAGFGIGLVQNMITGALGGKRSLAQIGAAVGSPLAKGAGRAIGRLIPTSLTQQ